MKQKITPCLWMDNEAEEAANFYVSVFPNSRIKSIERYNIDTPSNKPIGSIMTVAFSLDESEFLALNGGSFFKMNPSISFIIACKNIEEVDKYYEALSKDGKILMELGEYPFSKRYAWVEDKYGLSWQIILSDGHYHYKHKITPTLMFTQDLAGKAEEAMELYVSSFPEGKIGGLARYPAGREPDKEGTIMHGAVSLAGQEIFAMDRAGPHKFKFNEGLSLIIGCKDQKEMDFYYERLSAVPEAEVCGWLKDKFGVSWQLVTEEMDKFLKKKEVMEELLKMKRIDIQKLKEVYDKSSS